MTAVASQSLTRKQAQTLLNGQRWFAGANRQIASSIWLDVLPLAEGAFTLGLVRVEFEGGQRQLVVVVVDESLEDCIGLPDAQAALFRFIVDQKARRVALGTFEQLWKGDASGVRLDASNLQALSGEQSNSSFVVDDRFVVKVIRQAEVGQNPEVELLDALSTRDFPHVPRLGGLLRYRSDDGDSVDLALVTEKIQGAHDGWRFACSNPDQLLTHVAELGRTVAELHNTLAGLDGDDALKPEPFGQSERDRIAASIKRLSNETGFSRPTTLLEQLGQVPDGSGKCIRVHGDLHLGQTLIKGDEWHILDFEGEPTRSLEERRKKTSPLKDVAGMLRSFSYAEASSGRAGLATRLRDPFVVAYRASLDASLLPPRKDFQSLLAWYEVEKALYELDYEKRYRPDWVHVPRVALERLCDQFRTEDRDAPTTKIALPSRLGTEEGEG